MINLFEVAETNKMIEQENLDVRTITIGISLLDCIDGNIDVLCQNIYNKITTIAKDLVKTGEAIEKKYGIPIVNKRISVTPIGFIGASACKSSADSFSVSNKRFLDEHPSLSSIGCASILEVTVCTVNDSIVAGNKVPISLCQEEG